MRNLGKKFGIFNIRTIYYSLTLSLAGGDFESDIHVQFERQLYLINVYNE